MAGERAVETWPIFVFRVTFYVHRGSGQRFLLSQSTLREEFVEKKYQVFDIIGLLTILVQVNLSSPVERV